MIVGYGNCELENCRAGFDDDPKENRDILLEAEMNAYFYVSPQKATIGFVDGEVYTNLYHFYSTNKF